MNLTPKQRAFADFYIELGNATEAARRAGYSAKTAKSIGAENLTKPDIKIYIAKRQAKIESERTASLKEIQELRTAIMRGQEKTSSALKPQSPTVYAQPATLRSRCASRKSRKQRQRRVRLRTTNCRRASLAARLWTSTGAFSRT